MSEKQLEIDTGQDYRAAQRREWRYRFAGQALQGLILKSPIKITTMSSDEQVTAAAIGAVDYADALLTRLEQKAED